MPVYPMSIVLSVGQPLSLSRVQPLARQLTFADEVYRAVESDVQQVAGDARREPTWIEFETWLRAGAQPSVRAGVLAAFENALRFAVRAEVDTLVYPINRIRVKNRGPTGQGYRLGIAMIGPNFDFQTNTGTPAPLW